MIFSHPGQSDSHEQWAPVSDLMSALMLVFMFVAVIFIRSVVGDEQDCDRIIQALDDRFGAKFGEWNAQLIEERGIPTIRFNNGETIGTGEPLVMFEAGEDQIGERHQDILKKFFPAYMEVIQALEDQDNDLIQEIRIEGHTSSEARVSDSDTPVIDAYFINMKLSQNRARKVLDFVLKMPGSDGYRALAMSRVTANGLSSSRTLPSGGQEDPVRSRRVEFRILSAACQRANMS